MEIILKENKKYYPVLIILSALLFFTFIGVTAWYASEGNVFFSLIGNILMYLFLSLILIFLPAHLISHLVRCRISKKEVEKNGLSWDMVRQILLANGLAHQIIMYSEYGDYAIESELTLDVDPEINKGRFAEIFTESCFKIIFPILKRNWKPGMMKYRGVIAISGMSLFWGLIFCFISFLV